MTKAERLKVPKSDSWRKARRRLCLVRRRMKATIKARTARPNNPPITPPAMDPADVPVAPVLSTASAVMVEPALSSLVGVISRNELIPPTGVVVVGKLPAIGIMVVAEVVVEAELLELDDELEELELEDEVVEVVDDVVGLWLLVEVGGGRGGVVDV